MSEPSVGDNIIVKVRDGLSFTIMRTIDGYFIQCNEYKDVFASIEKNKIPDSVIKRLVNALRKHGIDIDPAELRLAFDMQFLSKVRSENEESSEPLSEEGEEEEDNEELEKLLPTPSFEDVLGTLIDNNGKNVLMNTWNGLRRALANFIKSDYRIVPIRPIPHMLLIEALRNSNRFVYYDTIDGEEVVVAKRSNDDYALFMLNERTVPLSGNDETSELIERLYTRYGCYHNEDGELTCLSPVKKRIFTFDGLRYIAYIKDNDLRLDFIRADVLIKDGNKENLESYILDPDDFTAISRWAMGRAIALSPTALKYLLRVAKRLGILVDNYVVGFTYRDDKIIWSPGITGYEPRKLTLKEAAEEAQKLRAVIDKIKDAYENPEPPLLFIGLNIAYTFFRPYRKLLNNADTPVPITFGLPGLGKTTITGTIIRMMSGLANKVEFITEGHNIAETIPRIGSFMTSTTLPGFLDNVVLTPNLAEIILQVGASMSNAISLARAKTSGIGLKDKLPLLRMIFPILNAKTENEIYNQFYKSARDSNLTKDQIGAIVNRRLLPINMNEAYPKDKDLRKELQDVVIPDLLALLRYVVENMQSDLINAMMQRGYPDVEGKYLNFLWFAYLFWKYILPKSVLTQVKFDDVAEPIRSVAEKRETERKYRFKIEIEEYKEKKKAGVAERDVLISAYRRWLQAQRRPYGSIADEVLAWLEDPYRAGLHITRPKENEEAAEIKRELAKLICRNGDNIADNIDADTDLANTECELASWVTDKLYKRIAELFSKKLLVVYVLQGAFSTDNDEGIGKISVLIGKNAKNVTLPDGRIDYGFRFTLPELLTVLYPSLRTDFENTPGKIGVGTDSVGSGGAHIEGGAQRVSASSDLRGTEHVGETEREGETEHRGTESAQTQAPPSNTEAPIPTGTFPTPNYPGVNLVNVSADCETECASKYPVVSPIAQIKYNQCIEECRQGRSMQSITEQSEEAKQASQTSETSESEEQGSTEQVGEASKQGETQQSQQVSQPQEVQNQQVQQPSGEESIGRMVITPDEYEKLKRKVLSGGNENQSQGGSFDWGSVESVGDGS